jgi:hypothetical protein
LIGIARLAMFALVFAGALSAAKNAFKPASLVTSTGASAGSVRLTMGLIATAAVLVLVLTIMASYPLRRLLPTRTALTLAAPAVLVGLVALALAYRADERLGAAAVGALLLPIVPFAASLLLAWGAPPVPQRARRSEARPSGPGDGLSGPPAHPSQQQRQRRGGRRR